MDEDFLVDFKSLINKAQENIETSELLFKNEKLGSAAYHVQQTIELMIKSYVVKFDLLKGTKFANLFKTHLPSKILLKDIFTFLVKKSDLIDTKTKPKKWLQALLDQSIEDIHNTITLMKKVDSSSTELTNLWKLSLGIEIHDSRVKKYFIELFSIDANLNYEIGLGLVRDFQKMYVRTIKKLTKERETHKIPIFKKTLLKATRKYGIPDNIVKLFITKTTAAKILDEMKKTDFPPIDIIELYYGDDSALFDLFTKSSTKDEDLRIIYRIKYVDILTAITLLTYPHEQIGRYSKIIDGKNSDEWYKEKKSELQNLILYTRDAFEQTKSLVMRNEKKVGLSPIIPPILQ